MKQGQSTRVTVAKPEPRRRTGWMRRCARDIERSAAHVSYVWNGKRPSKVVMAAIIQWRKLNNVRD